MRDKREAAMLVTAPASGCKQDRRHQSQFAIESGDYLLRLPAHRMKGLIFYDRLRAEPNDIEQIRG